MFHHVLFIILIFCSSLTVAVVIDTQYGPVRGREINVNNGQQISTVHEFRGIPYAKDTSGPGRFKNPVPPDPWIEPLDADVPGDSCPQYRAGLLSETNPEWMRFSENCLNLDIYSPDTSSAPNSFPVMLWIHGGSYQQGANVQFPGHFLATHGVVVVVLNYRLGKFGFAYTASDAARGNVGLWDQKMGLEFVVNNIANFGGDPTRITIFGESAGASSTSFHMLSPQSKDLFQSAILESGAETNYWVLNRPESQPEDYVRQVASQLGCLNDDDFVMMDCLRAESMEALLYNTSFDCAPGYLCLGMAPVIDGAGGFLPKLPSELRADGDIMMGPMIAGINKDEGGFTVPLLIPETLFGCCNRSFYQQMIRERILVDWLEAVDADTQDDVVAAVDWYYSQWPYVHENERNRESLIRIVTDTNFAADWDRQLKLHQEVADVFGYVFDYRSANSTIPEWMGVKHFDEIPYVWGWPMLQYNPQIWNESYLNPDWYFNEEDVQYSMYIQELFTNFAKYGDPTFVRVEKPAGGETVWPKFNLDNMQVLHLDRNISIVSKYNQKSYAFVKDYLDYVFFGDNS